jgi:hypothetical protein
MELGRKISNLHLDRGLKQSDLAPPLDRLQGSDGLEEGLLEDVLRIEIPAQTSLHPGFDPGKELSSQALDQALEGLAAAFLRSPEDGNSVFSRHSCVHCIRMSA